MKIKVLALSVLALAYSAVYGLDTNFLIDNDSTIKFDAGEYDTPVFEQTNNFTASVKVPFNNAGTSYFVTEATAGYKGIFYSGENAPENENSLEANLSLFKLFFIKGFDNASKLSFSAGRFNVADLSSMVFNQTSDGVLLSYNMQKFGVSLYGGYTGLLNVKKTDLMSGTGAVITAAEEKDIYDFAAPFVVGSFYMGFPYCLFNQNIELEGFAAIPAGGPGDYDLKDEESRFYGTVNLNGALASTVFYSLVSTLEYADSDMANLSQASVMVFPGLKYLSSVTVNGMFASSAGSSLEPFTALTAQSQTTGVNTLYQSGIVKAGIQATSLLTDKMLLSYGGDVVFTDNQEDSLEYNGIQAAVALKYQLYSDLQLSFSATTFAGSDSEDNNTSISIKAVFAF